MPCTQVTKQVSGRSGIRTQVSGAMGLTTTEAEVFSEVKKKKIRFWAGEVPILCFEIFYFFHLKD